MDDRNKERFIDAGMAESEQYEPDEEVAQEFADAQRLGSGNLHFKHELRDTDELEEDLAREEIIDEAAGGFSVMPEQDVVSELGEAVGLVYEDNEPLHTTEKMESRDRHRWELDPASSEDYNRRVNHEGE
jgi:hypothetical protein